MNQHWIRAMNLLRISLPLAAAFVALSGAPEAANAQDRGRGNGRGFDFLILHAESVLKCTTLTAR